jgi:hypothetical protein
MSIRCLNVPRERIFYLIPASLSLLSLAFLYDILGVHRNSCFSSTISVVRLRVLLW